MKALTREQVDQFWRDGYLVVPGVLSPDEVATVRQRVDEYITGERPVPAEFRLQKLLMREPRIERGELAVENEYDTFRKFDWPAYVDPIFREFGGHPNLVDLIEDVHDTEDIVLLTDQIFLKPPHHGSPSGFHQDCASWPHIVPHETITLWLALDDATAENGCLRYLPGTHKLGLILRDQTPHLLVDDVLRTEVLAPVPAGGCVLHHGLTFHGSGPNTTPHRRRGWAMHYAPAKSRDLSEPGTRGVGVHLGDVIHVRGRSYAGHV